MYKYYHCETWNGRTVCRTWIDNSYIETWGIDMAIALNAIFAFLSLVVFEIAAWLWFIPATFITVALILFIIRNAYVKRQVAKIIAELSSSAKQKELERIYEQETAKLRAEFKTLQTTRIGEMTIKDKERYELLQKTERFM